MRSLNPLVYNHLSLDKRKHLFIIFPEMRIIKNTRLAFLSLVSYVEFVHVELADEGGHVGVFVVIRQHRLRELRLVFDDEGVSSVSPGDESV